MKNSNSLRFYKKRGLESPHFPYSKFIYIYIYIYVIKINLYQNVNYIMLYRIQ